MPLTPLHNSAEKYENDGSRYWDLFYKRNGAKFFKDRHYFDKEFPDLVKGKLNLLEVGQHPPSH
jgi:methyltransferase-like protein 6